MKKTVSVILMVMGMFQVEAQDNIIKFDTQRKSFLKTMDLGDKGIIIKTGDDNLNSKNVNWEVSYYTADLDLIWKTPIEKTQINKGFNNPMIVAPSGAYFYQLEYIGYNTSFGAKKINATQIDRSGKVKTIFWDEDEADFILKSNVKLCNDEYIVFLEQEGKGGISKKALENDKMEIRRYSHLTMKMEKFNAALPSIKDLDNSSFWEYIGHGDDVIYFSYITFLKKEEKVYFYVAAVDYQGNLVNDFKIDGSLKDENYRASQAHNTLAYNSAGYPNTFDIYKYGDIVADVENDAIYVYGISGEKPPKSAANKCDGYFIQKYDLQGQEKWKIQRKVSEKHLDEGFFKIHGKELDRKIALGLRYDGGVELNIFFQDKLFTYEFDNEGEYVGKYDTEGVFGTQFGPNVDCGSMNMNINTKERSKVIPYFVSLDKKAAKNNRYRYYRSSQGEILIENDPVADNYKVMFFSN